MTVEFDFLNALKLQLVGDNALDITVIDDVLNLLRFEHFGERYQYIIGGQNSQYGNNLFNTLIGIDPDAGIFGKVQLIQVKGHLINSGVEFIVADLLFIKHQSGFIAMSLLCPFKQCSDTVY